VPLLVHDRSHLRAISVRRTTGGENDLVGGEITYSVLPGFLGGVSLKQAILYSFNGDDDGVNGRSVIGLDFAPDLGFERPFLAANFGGVYGRGVQDGFVAGPEIGFNIDLFDGVAMRAQVAYDYQFRNAPPGRGYSLGRAGLQFAF
jgi:hypothetical protein